MKKNILISFLIVLVLSSCNLPIAKTAADPSTDQIATRVAATMAVVQTSTVALTPVELPTLDSSTATIEPTTTVTVTPTPTNPPEDPKLILGDPDFWFNAASSGNPFGVASNPYEDEAVIISNQVNGLNLTSKAVNLGKRWRLTSPTPQNAYVEGTFYITTCAGRDNYGLVLRNPSYDGFLGYYIGLSCDGSYIVDRLDEAGNGYNLISWKADSHIKTGENQTNRLGIMLVNDSIKIYINGSLITEFTDSHIPNAGHFGVYTSAREKPNFSVVLQELLEWNQ